MRLIDKDSLLEKLSTFHPDYTFNITAFRNFVNAEPVVEQKKGKWIKHEVRRFDGCHTGRYFEECSECGKLTPEWRLVTEYHYWNFCPRCGADMMGEDNG